MYFENINIFHHKNNLQITFDHQIITDWLPLFHNMQNWSQHRKAHASFNPSAINHTSATSQRAKSVRFPQRARLFSPKVRFFSHNPLNFLTARAAVEASHTIRPWRDPSPICDIVFFRFSFSGRTLPSAIVGALL